MGIHGTLLLPFREDGPTPFGDLPVAPLDRTWDASAAVKRMRGTGDTPDFDRLRRGHLWVDTEAIQARGGEPTMGDLKLPFADVIDGRLTAVWAGLAAGRQRLSATEIPADDKATINRTIDKYVKKINAGLPEGEAPKPLSTDEGFDPDDPHREGTHLDKPRDDSAGWVQRVDFAGPMLSPVMRADGSLLLSGRVAKPGILVYRLDDGSTRRELLLAEDLHRKEDLATLGRAPVTLEHPTVPVTPDNFGQVSVGDLDGDVFVEEEGFVTIKMAVRRRDAIDAVIEGKQELSPGYIVRLEETSGEHEIFGRFDAIQRERRYNHLAIVDRARGGPSVRLRTDGAAIQIPDSPGGTVDPILIALLTRLGVPADRMDDMARAINLARPRVDALLTAEINLTGLQEQVTTLEAANATLTADKETLTGEKAALEQRISDFEAAATVKQDAEDRVDLDKLRTHLKVDAVEDEDNATLRKRLAAKVLGGEDKIRADASDDFLRGIVGTALAAIPATARKDMWKPLEIDPNQPRTDRDDNNNPERRTDDAPKRARGADAYLDQAKKAFTNRPGVT
jgi:hypothetical protein